MVKFSKDSVLTFSLDVSIRNGLLDHEHRDIPPKNTMEAGVDSCVESKEAFLSIEGGHACEDRGIEHFFAVDFVASHHSGLEDVEGGSKGDGHESCEGRADKVEHVSIIEDASRHEEGPRLRVGRQLNDVHDH